jgi:hypothetical protein
MINARSNPLVVFPTFDSALAALRAACLEDDEYFTLARLHVDADVSQEVRASMVSRAMIQDHHAQRAQTRILRAILDTDRAIVWTLEGGDQYTRGHIAYESSAAGYLVSFGEINIRD